MSWLDCKTHPPPVGKDVLLKGLWGPFVGHRKESLKHGSLYFYYGYPVPAKRWCEIPADDEAGVTAVEPAAEPEPSGVAALRSALGS